MQKINYVLLSAIFIFSTITPEQTMLDQVREGNVKAIKERIKNNGDCSLRDKNNNNALHIAAEKGTEEHAEIIDILTTEPVYPEYDLRWLCSKFGGKPTLPDKNAKNKDGKIPLNCSIENGRVQATDILLKKGADATITDKEGISPVFSMVKNNKTEFVPLIIKYQLTQQTKDGDDPFHYAVKNNLFLMVEKFAEDKNLANKPNKEGKTVAMLAAEKEEPECLIILHSKGINLNDAGSFGRQPIHSSTLTGCYETTKYLLVHGVNVNAIDDNNDTPLLLGIRTNKKDIVDLLLQYKADPTQRNNQGEDGLNTAIKNRRYDLIKRLNHVPGINIDNRDIFGRTPFLNAVIAREHPTTKTLYECGADLFTTDNNGENALHKIGRNDDTDALSLWGPAYSKDFFNAVNIYGDNPGFVAAYSGNINTLIMLVHAGSSLEKTNNNKETIFHQIAKTNKPSMLTTVIEQYHPRIDIREQSKDGLPAIHYASAGNNVEMMHAFVHYGASLTDMTSNNDTLAHTAAKSEALASLQDLKYRMPMMLEQRNKDNHTPFIVAAAHGKNKAIDFLYHEDNKDMSIAISIARKNNHLDTVKLLEQKEKDLIDKCVKISQMPQEIIKLHPFIRTLDQNIAGMDSMHYFKFTQLTSPQQYSASDLYHMKEAQRTQISLEHEKLYNQTLQQKIRLEQKLNGLIAQKQEQQRQQQERLRQEQYAEEQRKQAERERTHREQQKLDRLTREKNDADARKLQAKELKKHNEQKRRDDESARRQKADLDYYAQQKTLTDAAKHAAALDKQQAHVPMNLQETPKATVENKTLAVPACAKCNKTLPKTKPIPCQTCKEKAKDVCNQCIKNQEGRCSHCLDLYKHGVEKEEGECALGFDDCKQEKGVTVMPCNNCKKKSSSSRICQGCLQEFVDTNNKKKVAHICPICRQEFDNNLINKILSRKK